MKIYEIINEKVSSVLFHVIDFHGAASMLQQDKLRQKQVSFTRSLTGEYHLGNKMIGVVFEFDGDLLNRNYKGGPVGTEGRDLDDNLEYRGKENKQLEDRIYTKNGLEQVTKYIKSAVMFCPIEFVTDSEEDEFEEAYADSITHISAVLKLLSKNKISFRYAASVKELYNKNSNNKDGFLKAIAEVDESVAISLGLKVRKKFRVSLTLGKQLPKGEIDNYSGENFSYTTEDFSIIASSIEAAQKEAQQMVDKLNADLSDEVKKARSEEWFLDDVEEQY